MEPHSNSPHDAYETETLDRRSYALARLLSQIFHPILLNIFAFLIVGYAALSTPAEGLKVWTLNRAYVSFEEEVKGSITPGKFAYLVFLDRDPRSARIHVRCSFEALYAVGAF